MQTKSSYRVLKWTFIFGAMASLGTACVVTSGDGNNDGEGGESGSTSEAGKTSTAGTGGSTSTAGKTSGGSAGTGGTVAPVGGAGGAGGEAYQVGLCDRDEPDPDKGILPTNPPSCAPSANDEGQDCKKCLKDKCCMDWQNCYGDSPHIACGWGPTEQADGQWDCIENCIIANEAGDVTIDAVVATCSAACTNQCEADDGGNVLIATADLIKCAQKESTCLDTCFPLN